MRYPSLCREEGDHSAPYPRLCLLVALLSSMAFQAIDAADRDKDPFQGDARLQRPVTIRVSRMPIADLLQRLGSELGVPLTVEGDDVGDQKLDLFTHGEPVTAVGILAAVTDLLNAEAPPRSYRWDRFGEAPRFRYALVRDVASRQWEEEHAAAAEARMPKVLRERFAALGREPFRPEVASRAELPTMRQLLPTLTDAQLAQLCRDRHLELFPADCTPAQKALFQPLLDELFAADLRRQPLEKQERIASTGPPRMNATCTLEVLVRGAPPRYLLEVGIGAGDDSSLGQLGLVGYADDPAVVGAGDDQGVGSASRRAPGGKEPVFALPPRTAWRMGDVLADIAARARVNLIADDYTLDWSRLRGYGVAQPLSQWLAAIRRECGFAASRAGSFVLVRNRAWYQDRKREVPSRLIARWRRLLHGSAADRMQMLVEIAQRAPFSTHPRITWDRMRVLTENPELDWTIRQDGPRTALTVFDMVAVRQIELHLYDRLPATQKQRVLTSGLTLQWAEIPDDLRAWFLRAFTRLREEKLRSSTLFMRCDEKRFQMNWVYPALPGSDERELYWDPQPADDPQRLVGQPLPELEVVDTTGKASTLRLSGPLLLYVTPAWPRPLVAPREEFADLKTLGQMDASKAQILGTEATATELRDWWKERGLAVLPLALRPDSAQRLGVHHLPLAIVVDRTGRITWVKEGFAPGDEAEWRRQLERAGG
jgi:hypothetical protein